MSFGWVNIKPTDVGVEINKIAGKVSDFSGIISIKKVDSTLKTEEIFRVPVPVIPEEGRFFFVSY